MDIRRGIIRKFDSGTYLADVQILGSMATLLSGVPVAKQIEADLLTSGTKCGVLFFDETNPADACVVFVYDGAPSHPSARVYHSVAQTIPHNTWTNLVFNSERWDTDGIHDTVTYSGRLTCQTAGKYFVIGQVAWQAGVTTGQRMVAIRHNGTRFAQVLQEATSLESPNQIVSTILNMTVGDYATLSVFQNSGGNLDVLASGPFSPEFMMVRVAS